MNNTQYSEELFSVVEDLYVYCHLNWVLTKSALIYTSVIMTILTVLFLITMLKMIIIFLYFFVFHFFINLFRYILSIFYRKFKINIWTDIKYICIYITRIFKKAYTYNFYSYENKAYGGITVSLYILYLFYNILFTILSFLISLKEQDPTFNPMKKLFYIYIIALISHLLIELHCSTFFITRNKYFQFILVLVCFFAIFISVLFTAYIKMIYEIDTQKPRRIVGEFQY